MKVLWFANTPCGASEMFNKNQFGGGWLKSLENQLVQCDNIELSVCFYYGEFVEPFSYNKTTYYPLLRVGRGSKVGRIISRAKGCTYNDKVDIYNLLELVDKVKPDIIHIHGTEDNFGLIQSMVKIPVIISIQGILSPYLEKYFAGISFFSAYRYEGLMSKLLFLSVKSLYRDMKRRAERERVMLSHAKYIIGRTHWDRRVTRVLAPNSNYFVGNEILRPSFYKYDWNKDQFGSTIKIVTIMSSGLYKGLETIVKTSQVLIKNGSVDFEWIVIGQNKSDDLVRIIEKWLNIDFEAININLVGGKSESEIVDILLSCDIYCQVSHIENSPNSLCEAMLIGMPIVASNVGGTSTLLSDNVEGILVQDGDPYSFAGSILEFVNNSEMAFNYAGAAKIRARNRHNPMIIVEQLLYTYNSITNN